MGNVRFPLIDKITGKISPAVIPDLSGDYATVDEPIGAAAQGTANAAIPKSTATTKGDLLAATGAGAFARLAAGTSGQLLLADSTKTVGLRYASVQEPVARAFTFAIATDPQWAGGADPTGASDSTAAILAAAASIGNTVGGTVWVGNGTFTCNTVDGNGNVLAFANKQMFTFRGAGKGTILQFTSGTATDFLRFDTCTRASISDFWIQIVGSGTKVTNALHITTASPGSAHQIDVSNVTVYGIGGSYRFAHDCSTTTSGAVVTSATAAFAAGDVGGTVGINQTTGPVVATISSVATRTSTISNGGLAITAVQTTVPLAAPLTGVPNSQYTIVIDSEVMLVTGGFQTSTLTVSRAVGSTSSAASTHADGATVTTYQATLSANASATKWPAVARVQSPTTPVMVNGIALGTDHPGASNMDLASVTLRGCTVNTAAASAFVAGNGTAANVLANVMHGCEAGQSLYGLFLNGGGLKIHGANFSTNGVEVKVGQLCSDPISITALRSEGASMLYENALSTTSGQPVGFKDIMVDAFVAPDGVPLRHQGSSPLTIDTAFFLYWAQGKTVSFSIAGTGSSTPCNVVGLNVVTNGGNSIWPAAVTTLRVTTLGGGRLNSSNQVVSSLDGQRIDGAFVRPLIKQTTSGAVTIDAATGNAAVTLNGNATSTTISNPTDGQDLEITYVQDATGGRTYAWPANCKFAGGSAPSDTTASKRTSVRFVYDAATTSWYERSRAVAVG